MRETWASSSPSVTAGAQINVAPSEFHGPDGDLEGGSGRTGEPSVGQAHGEGLGGMTEPDSAP